MPSAAVTQARSARHASARVLAAIAAFAVLPAGRARRPADVVNALRVEGCGARAGRGAPVRRDSALDAAARELARGTKLQDALARVGYPVASSASFHVRGSRGDAAIRRALEAGSCDNVNDPKLAELGVHQSGDDTWIVMAGRTRFRSPRCRIRPPLLAACSSS